MKDKNVVFVPADEPNIFTACEIELVATESGRTVIKNGLNPGEHVVVEGAILHLRVLVLHQHLVWPAAARLVQMSDF